MTTEFDRLAQVYQEGAYAMIQAGTRAGIANYLLEGTRDHPVKLWAFFGIYPSLPPLASNFFAFATDPEKDFNQARREILSLRLPERIRRLSIDPDQTIRLRYEELCAMTGMPSILLAAGERIQTQEMVLLLFTITGITPDEALSTIQVRIRQAYAKSN